MVGSSACRCAVVRTTWHTNPHKINTQRLAIFLLCNEIKKTAGKFRCNGELKINGVDVLSHDQPKDACLRIYFVPNGKRGSQRRGKVQFKVIAKIVCKSKVPSGKNGQIWSSAIPRPSGYHLYEGHSEIIDTLPPPFPNEDERFIHQLEIQCHCRGWILWTLWIKTGSKEKTYFSRQTSTPPLLHDQLSFESKLPLSACFFSILRRGENSRWIDDQVTVGEEIVESR